MTAILRVLLIIILTLNLFQEGSLNNFMNFGKSYFETKILDGKAENVDRKCGYEGCPMTHPDMLNVHVVAHTHDDVGWLKTVDQYYYGSKSQFQKAGVQYIIDSVIQALLNNPERRFIYVESAFFSKWWQEQDDEMKSNVRMLVDEGRLEFVGGAWSMNDEAITHYQSLIDQFTWGLRFLDDNFGKCSRPRIGWQIDPFGHSLQQASLFAKMGYDGLFFSRLDYQDKEKRQKEKTMEMIWKTNQDLDEADLFTGVLYQRFYNAPDYFCFDILCNDEPIIDDIHSTEYNVDKRVEDFVRTVRNMSESYQTNNLMLTFGGDFTFMAAQMYFKNLDKLIKYTNERQDNFKVNTFYSTPSCYLKSLHESNTKWPIKSDDFFPYASDPHSYWTGYYTSRPTSKRFERIGNHFLQICKQLSAMAEVAEDFYDENLKRLKSEMGVMQHHDAITGTEKQHVTEDYHRELYDSIKGCEDNTRSSLNQLMIGHHSNGTNQLEFQFNSCLNLNISVCEVTESSSEFMVTVYNPISHETYQNVKIPVHGDSYIVRDYLNRVIDSQIIPIPTPVMNLHYRISKSSHELIFQAKNIPAIGYKSYYVTKTTTAPSEDNKEVEENLNEPEIVTIGDEELKIIFDSNGLVSEIIVDGVSSKLSQNFIYYKGANMNNEIFANRSSGAYIFRPEIDSVPVVVSEVIKIEVHKGEIVDEVHQIFNEWISQVVRIYKTSKYVEFEWLVGPIAIDDGIGKEIVSIFQTDIKSNDIFYTDSNGRNMLKRIRNKRETWDIEMNEKISGNYYPITTKIAIEDENHRLAILTDRPQGGSSLTDGSIELMVHRRLLRDDTFGVGEPLNETAYGEGLIVRGKHWIFFGTSKIKKFERIHQNELHLPNWLFFDNLNDITSFEWALTYNLMHSGLKTSLPTNVHLLTYEPWKENSILIRFEHIFESNEDGELSKPAIFNISEVFHGAVDFTEMTLAANQLREELNRLNFNEEEVLLQQNDKKTNLQLIAKILDPMIVLEPMEIRTFIVTFNSGNSLLVSFNFILSTLIIFLFKYFL
ncbi:CLUMA_CG000160, isoform A [Clunio marinus]|uniref:Alpha-mannosidase n=1 Tax=Clunio marinus TaxID=568069 RepID=A0A1J1HED6_9DIPT|nr:CLUMA_CG000160, isoform A [Clunio marinus]